MLKKLFNKKFFAKTKPSRKEIQKFVDAAAHDEEGEVLAYAEKFGRAALDLPGPRDGYSALMWAGVRGSFGICKKLIGLGADVNWRNEQGWTALQFVTPTYGAVELLLDHGADIDAADNDGWTALMTAASRGCEDVVDLLLERGANPALRTLKGETAAELARARDAHCIAERIESVIAAREAATRAARLNDADRQAQDSTILQKDTQVFRALRFRRNFS